MNTVALWYERYVEQTFGTAWPAPIRAELERAFYAGAYVMLDSMTRADFDLSRIGVMALRESLDSEIIDFFERFNQTAHANFRSVYPPGNA